MDVALLLLALLGHAALWVGLVNRIHARGLPRWIIRSTTICLLRHDGAGAAGLAWWCFAPTRRSSNGLRAGEFCPLAPLARVGLSGCLLDCRGGDRSSCWLRRHVLHRPPAVVRFHRIRSLFDRDAPPPPPAEQPHHFLVRLPGNQSLHLDVRERAIEVPRLPPALDGLSLVHLSDLHFTGRVGKPYFQEIVRLSNELQPDLVAADRRPGRSHPLHRLDPRHAQPP